MTKTKERPISGLGLPAVLKNTPVWKVPSASQETLINLQAWLGTDAGRLHSVFRCRLGPTFQEVLTAHRGRPPRYSVNQGGGLAWIEKLKSIVAKNPEAKGWWCEACPICGKYDHALPREQDIYDVALAKQEAWRMSDEHRQRLSEITEARLREEDRSA